MTTPPSQVAPARAARLLERARAVAADSAALAKANATVSSLQFANQQLQGRVAELASQREAMLLQFGEKMRRMEELVRRLIEERNKVATALSRSPQSDAATSMDAIAPSSSFNVQCDIDEPRHWLPDAFPAAPMRARAEEVLAAIVSAEAFPHRCCVRPSAVALNLSGLWHWSARSSVDVARRRGAIHVTHAGGDGPAPQPPTVEIWESLVAALMMCRAASSGSAFSFPAVVAAFTGIVMSGPHAVDLALAPLKSNTSHGGLSLRHVSQLLERGGRLFAQRSDAQWCCLTDVADLAGERVYRIMSVSRLDPFANSFGLHKEWIPAARLPNFFGVDDNRRLQSSYLCESGVGDERGAAISAPPTVGDFRFVTDVVEGRTVVGIRLERGGLQAEKPTWLIIPRTNDTRGADQDDPNGRFLAMEMCWMPCADQLSDAVGASFVGMCPSLSSLGILSPDKRGLNGVLRNAIVSTEAVPSDADVEFFWARRDITDPVVCLRSPECYVQCGGVPTVGSAISFRQGSPVARAIVKKGRMREAAAQTEGRWTGTGDDDATDADALAVGEALHAALSTLRGDIQSIEARALVGWLDWMSDRMEQAWKVVTEKADVTLATFSLAAIAGGVAWLSNTADLQLDHAGRTWDLFAAAAQSCLATAVSSCVRTQKQASAFYRWTHATCVDMPFDYAERLSAEWHHASLSTLVARNMPHCALQPADSADEVNPVADHLAALAHRSLSYSEATSECFSLHLVEATVGLMSIAANQTRALSGRLRDEQMLTQHLRSQLQRPLVADVGTDPCVLDAIAYANGCVHHLLTAAYAADLQWTVPMLTASEDALAERAEQLELSLATKLLELQSLSDSYSGMKRENDALAFKNLAADEGHRAAASRHADCVTQLEALQAAWIKDKKDYSFAKEQWSRELLQAKSAADALQTELRMRDEKHHKLAYEKDLIDLKVASLEGDLLLLRGGASGACDRSEAGTRRGSGSSVVLAIPTGIVSATAPRGQHQQDAARRYAQAATYLSSPPQRKRASAVTASPPARGTGTWQH